MHIVEFKNICDFVNEVNRATTSSTIEISPAQVDKLLNLNHALLHEHSNPAIGTCYKSLAEKIRIISKDEDQKEYGNYANALMKKAEGITLPPEIISIIIGQVVKKPENISELRPISQVSKEFLKITRKTRFTIAQQEQIPFKQLGMKTIEEAAAFIKIHQDRLSYIDLRGLDGTVDGDFLTTLAANCPNIQHLFIENGQFTEDDLPCITSLQMLTTLSLKACNKIRTFPGLDQLAALEKLEIIDCKCLAQIPSLNALTNLRSLIIHAPKLTSFPVFKNCEMLGEISIECKKK